MKLTRRDFIKKSAATSGVVLAAGTAVHAMADKPKTSAMAEATAQPKAPGQGEWVATTCQGCTSWCSAEALVQDGRVVKVRGNQNSKSAEGYLCSRGHLSIGQMYDPDRIKVPMKRTNPKDLAICGGVLTDKALLLAGQATHITEEKKGISIADAQQMIREAQERVRLRKAEGKVVDADPAGE